MQFIIDVKNEYLNLWLNINIRNEQVLINVKIKVY